MLIDTHAHLYLKEFKEDLNEVLSNAKNVGVQKILLPNIDETTIEPLNDLCNQHPNFCLPMMGLHPSSVNGSFKKSLEIIKDQLTKQNYIAIGEIGIDLYWDDTFLKEQIEAFEIQIDWAKEMKLPIVIHARDSFEEIFSVLDKKMDKSLFGVFHCFTGGIAEMEKIFTYKNFYFGIGGILTFKNAGLDKVVSKIPLDKLVLETDSPYLSPVPYRGKRNQSSYLYNIAEKLAEVKNVSLDKLIETTGNNAVELFKLKD